MRRFALAAMISFIAAGCIWLVHERRMEAAEDEPENEKPSLEARVIALEEHVARLVDLEERLEHLAIKTFQVDLDGTNRAKVTDLRWNDHVSGILFVEPIEETFGLTGVFVLSYNGRGSPPQEYAKVEPLLATLGRHLEGNEGRLQMNIELQNGLPVLTISKTNLNEKDDGKYRVMFVHQP